MESRWTDYAGRNRELPGGPASFLVRFSGGEAGTLWSAHSETPRAFRRLEELISGLEEEMESAGRPAPSPAGRYAGRGPDLRFRPAGLFPQRVGAAGAAPVRPGILGIRPVPRRNAASRGKIRLSENPGLRLRRQARKRRRQTERAAGRTVMRILPAGPVRGLFH